MTARRAIHLVRHADAGDRAAWTRPDRFRPLSKRGVAQAAAISEQLRTRPVRRVISSPYVRCVETLEPLGEHLGLEVEEADYLAEGHDTSRVAAHLLAAALALAPDGELAACSHGDIVPFVVSAFAADGELELDERSSPKGVRFTIVFEGERVASIERTAPPRP